MTRIKSLDELKQLQSKLKSEAEKHKSETKVLVSMATCGIAAGAKDTMAALQSEIEKQGLGGVKVSACGCMGVCYAEPTVEIKTEQGSVLYGNVTPDKARKIVDGHLKNGEPVRELIIEKPY